MAEYLRRLEALVGQDKIDHLKTRHVMVCGVGGVGSFVAEALARSGIGTLTLVDFDKIEESNLNRQLMSAKNNIGQYKVDVMKRRIEEISDCKVIPIVTFIDQDFALLQCDYVVDCIDSLRSKFELVKMCHEQNIPVLSALGSAKRINIRNIKRTTLDKTRNDPLAKAFRNLAKKEGYHHRIDVVFEDEAPLITDNKELGSSIFVVGSVGLYIAECVFSDLIRQ